MDALHYGCIVIGAACGFVLGIAWAWWQPQESARRAHREPVRKHGATAEPASRRAGSDG